MAEVTAIARLLKTIPYLRGLSREAYAKLARRTRERTYRAGQIIFREGAEGDALYLIKEGEVEIVKGRGKTQTLLARRAAGEYFGEMGLLEGAKRSATIRARTAVTVLEVPGNTMTRILLQYPRVLLETARMLSDQLRQADTRIISDLKKQNAELNRAYKALQKAQVEIVEKERLEREMSLAREVQTSLLPRELPPIGAFHFAGQSRPADVVGGDFFDVFTARSGAFGVMVASVASQGVNAAIFMALVHALVVAEGRRQTSPQIVARRVHHLLLELAKPTMPVSIFYGVVDVQERVLRYINAGSALAMLRDANGEVELLRGEAHMLAAALHTDVEERTISLHAGCGLLLPSAGLVAANNAAGEAYGTDRLQRALQRGPHTPEELRDFVLADLDAHVAGAVQRSDQTLLVLHYAA